MDDAGTLRGLPAFVVGPGFHLHFAGGNECFQVQQFIDSLDEAVAAALLQAQVFEEHLLLLVGFQLCNICLGLSGDDHQLGVFILDGFAHLLHIGIACGGGGIIDVADVEHGLGGEEEHLAGARLLVFVLRSDGAGTASLFQGFLVAEQESVFRLGLLVAAHLGLFFHTLDAVLHRFQVFQLELGVDDFLVAHGVHRAVHVDDVAVVEAAQHVDDGVALADVAQELVAQSFALAGAFHQSGDVHDVAHGGDDASRMYQFGQFGQPFIGYGYLAHLGVNRAKGKVCRLRLCAGQAVEKGGFPHVGEAHDTCFKCHSLYLVL